MDTIQFVVCLATLIALFFFFKIRSKKAPETTIEPPEPVGAWPIIGHLGILAGAAPFHRTLADLSAQYGPIFALRLGQKRAIVVSSMELAKECLTTNDRALTNRPPLISSRILGYDRAVFALAPYGPYWRDMRKISTVQLLSSQRLESLKHVWLEEIGSLVSGLYAKCRDGELVEMKCPLRFLTLSIIVRMVAGKRYLELDNNGNEKEREFIQLIEESFYLLGQFTVSDALPWLKWLDVDGYISAMKRVYKKMDEVATSWVKEHRQRMNMGGGDDFIDILINEMGDSEHADTIIKSLALTMIAAGSDTTSGTLVWAISLLLNNRHALKKAQDELDVHVGKERQVDESDIKNLTYLQAIVKEVMRLYPVGPLLMPHESIEPVNVGGYYVPAGTTLYINV